SNDSLLNDDEDLFAFWEGQNDLYPFLYLIARDVLIVSATNTAVERCFSASENSVTEACTLEQRLLFIINSGTTASKGEKR
ncbi:unnamed protein product, partial [Rotaria sordida]